MILWFSLLLVWMSSVEDKPSRCYQADCQMITTRVLNMIFYMLSSLIGEGLGTSCREICRSTFCAILACYQHRAILNVRWRELWPLRKDALVKSCGAKDSTGELIGWGVGTVVKRCTFHWLISNDTCIAQKEMVLDSLIIHHLIMITCISCEIISSISLSKFWLIVLHLKPVLSYRFHQTLYLNTDCTGLKWGNTNICLY